MRCLLRQVAGGDAVFAGKHSETGTDFWRQETHVGRVKSTLREPYVTLDRKLVRRLTCMEWHAIRLTSLT